MRDLSSKRILVVGATGGIGIEILTELTARGAAVIGTGRNGARLADIKTAGGIPLVLELDDPYAAAQGARAAVEREFGAGLDGLVLSAGGYGPIGPTRTAQVGDLEKALAANLLSPLAIVQAVSSALDDAAEPSVAFLSGGGATDAFPFYTAYALSKVATVRLVENLAAEEPSWKVNAIAPGFVATAIHDATMEVDPAATGGFRERTEDMMKRAVAPSVAAELIAFLMSSASHGISGRLISAVWDPWREAAGVEALRHHTSFGRLRRIDGHFYRDSEDSV